MKQIRYEAFGQPSRVAKCVDVADVGPPSAWEVVVDVEAFPINVADLAMLAGRYGKLPSLPATIGMEGVGRIVDRGSAVKELNIGDRVVLLANDNWSERRKVPVAAVHKVPADADVNQLAMLKVNPTTAFMLLNHFVQMEVSDWIIQNAPLSSVGGCVIQLAKAKGIRTVNIVRRAETIPQVLELGGDIVIEDGPNLAERVEKATRNEPIRLALDAVAGPGIQSLAECLAEGSKIVNYGMLSGEACVLEPEQTIFRGITLVGFWLSKMLNRLSLAERKSLFDTLSQMMVDGSLKIDIDSCYGIKDIGDAIRRAEQAQRGGKVIVRVSGHESKA